MEKIKLETKGKSKRCKTCKEKQVELPPVEELLIEEPLLVFDEEDIVKAYYEMTRREGIKEESKVFINGVYQQLFNEEFRFDNCHSCKNTQYHKLRNYILYKLKKRI